MKKFITIISLAALMMPVSCTKDEFAGPDQDNATKDVMEFTAVMEGAASKTTIDTETGNVTWKAGDAIKFDYEIQKADSEPVVSSSLTNEDINDGVATFRAEVPAEFSMTNAEYKATLEENVEASRHLYVAYPASLVTEYTTSSYYVTIPTVQDGKFESASISLAKWNINKPNDPLDFRNLCGLLQVKVAADDVRQIKVTSSDYIAGKVNVGFASKLPFDPYIKEEKLVNEVSKTVTVNIDGPGTYYVAVAPGVFEEFYVELLGEADAEGNRQALGDRLAKSDITVERAHVLPLGTLGTGSFAAEGGFFVKPEAAGNGDGSSWDNAANYEGFFNKVHNDKRSGGTKGDPVTMVVYMAGGIYDVNSQLNVTPTDNIKIYGGYPANLSGLSLSGRDIEQNATVLTHTKYKDTNDTDWKIWNLTAGSWLVDGLTFTNAYGGAITLKKAIKFECVNCNIKGNSSKTHSSGVSFADLEADSEVSFVNCVFEDNKVTAGTGYGAAVGSSSKYYNATVEFNKCVFRNNMSTKGGGAIWARTVNYRLTDCCLINNDVTTNDKKTEKEDGTITETKYGGEAILVERNYGVSVYCDRCYFASSAGTQPVVWVGNVDQPDTESNASFYMNNSVVAGNWGVSNSQIKNVSVGNVVISNSTLSGQNSVGIIENTGRGSVSVINSIVVNTLAANNGTAFVNSEAGTLDINNSLYSVYSGSSVNSLGDIYLKKEVGNFPTTGDLWYDGGATGMKANNRTSSTAVDDCRGKVHFYEWDGTYPIVEEKTFTPTTMEIVNGLIQAADKGFYDWLTANGSLNKDIRGEVRTDLTWPGSYQE